MSKINSSLVFSSLAELEKAITHDLDCMSFPNKNWSVQKKYNDQNVLDVAILGAGQAGIAIGFGLLRHNIHNILIFDKAIRGKEGPWTTYARMITLRTPKYLKGPELGYSNLSFRSWYEASFGQEAWQMLDKIPKETWKEYLDWFRDINKLPVESDRHCINVQWDSGIFSLLFKDHLDREYTVYARKIVLATGIDGNGKWFSPDFLKTLPKEYYAHTSEPIDFSKLKGKRIGVLGGGASAFDNAATALEQDVGRVDLCLRRKTIPSVNPHRWMEQTGFLCHYPYLPDDKRWAFMQRICDLNQPPPQDTFWRCRKHENFAYHTDCQWKSVELVNNEIHIETTTGKMIFDFLIIGTGFTIDLTARPETASYASSVALWSDRYTPNAGMENTVLGSYPYLTENYQFLPKNKNDPNKEMLSSIYNFTFGSLISMGLAGASISGMYFGVDRLIKSIGKGLFLEDQAHHLQSLLDYDVKELVDLSPPS
ncbi:Predicted flavoprotein CzcO associated with the cation diffusion facilitator CzcD (CzcO) (PDB:4USQ) [Commensalibacter communis]|uniref:NAD(P)-binding domain-containing protein n=1 Tax=Commensalibacter communis TaxID=2972786 RepID=UPI0022FF5F9E|nr:NAD(P)/FAD-dependent oxidoreductase [Commensalibacter communis]CAI3958580.1 Predicted flavoprotein CzcO associated with the cation diffusion facilitator CzcD (CzcO) (PDB:4USQ) [Commensalibacter communis]